MGPIWDTYWTKAGAEQVAADYERDTGCRPRIRRKPGSKTSYGVYAPVSCKPKRRARRRRRL